MKMRIKVDGKKLRTLVERNGIARTELSKIVGYSKSYIGNVMAYNEEVRTPVAKTIAEILGCKVEDFEMVEESTAVEATHESNESPDITKLTQVLEASYEQNRRTAEAVEKVTENEERILVAINSLGNLLVEMLKVERIDSELREKIYTTTNSIRSYFKNGHI